MDSEVVLELELIGELLLELPGIADEEGGRRYELDPEINDPSPDYTPFPWDPHPWVIGTFESKRVEEPGSAFVSQYCFDPLTARLKRKRVRASASSPQSHDVIVETTREFEILNAGQQNEMQAIHYEDFVYGGDLQEVDTGSDLCNILLPSDPPIYRTLNTQIDGTLALTEPLDPDDGTPIQRTLDLAIDRSTGLAKTSTDPAGVATDLEYDRLGRLLWIKPSASGDAWTEIYYCAAETDDPDCDLGGLRLHQPHRRPQRPRLESGLRPPQRPAPRHRPRRRRRRDLSPLPPQSPRHAAPDHRGRRHPRGPPLLLPLRRRDHRQQRRRTDEVHRAESAALSDSSAPQRISVRLRRFGAGCSGIQGVPKYLHDYSTLMSGGRMGNLAVTYLAARGESHSAG